MKIRFGMNLDGQHGRPPANLLGCLDVGPLGLMTILESQLGLPPPTDNSAQRCVQFRECLHQLNNPMRFYHQSFNADDFGAAATLLSWRDDWRLHGWSGDKSEAGSLRLKDMVEIEALAQKLLSPGPAERLEAILAALRSRKHLITSITLTDPLENLPARWRDVLKQLPIEQAQPPSPCGHGLLGELQRALASPSSEGTFTPIKWRDDGSIKVVRGETNLIIARWIADTLGKAGPDTLYVATSEAAITDSFLIAADNPRQGLSEFSAYRPALQLLPLFLELLWKPLNFNALIQFLTHPICPLPGKVRRQLAKLQSQYPGIGGPRWLETIKQIEEDAGDRADVVRESIDFWINHPRFDIEHGVPVATLLERTQRLLGFFRNTPSDSAAALRMAYSAGYIQCSSFAANLTELLSQGVETLKPRQIEQLATQATARGSKNPLYVAETGALPCITHPGAVIEAHEVVLWGPLDVPNLPNPWPWSTSEIEALKAANCDLPDAESLLQLVAADWLRPIMAAKEQLILVLPPTDRESHPVWQMLKILVPNLKVDSIESLLSESASNLVPVEHKPLPAIKRWWQLPPGTVIPAVPEYSFSQLEKQIYNPFHWLLSNAAKLRAGSLLSLIDDFRLKGILAHSLVERLYRDSEGLTINDNEFEAWFDAAFDQLIEEEGAIYLMPGRRSDRDNIHQTLKKALIELRGILRAAQVTAVDPEHKLTGHFVGGTLVGYSDIVLTGPDKSQAIIDLKWAGKSHKTKLEQNRHLQLATYAELIRQNSGQWPVLAYFILSQGKLLTRDDGWFPGSLPVTNQTDENTAQLWQRFLVTWKWRQAQFAEGFFEVVLDLGDEPESIPPEDGLQIEVLNASYNECLHLAGWDTRS